MIPQARIESLTPDNAAALFEDFPDEAWHALADICDESAGSSSEGPLWVGVLRFPDRAVVLFEDSDGHRSYDITTNAEADQHLSAADAIEE
jgi:hypothetical protein